MVFHWGNCSNNFIITRINKGSKINKGDKFVITGIEGNKLTVKLKED